MRLFVLLMMIFFSSVAYARDNGQWENSDPVVTEWMKTLMQPDNPGTSCCGEADAYWCDSITVKRTVDTDYLATERFKTFCTITDDRDDAPRGRPHVDVGTVIEIPDYKLKYDRGNPTGHAIVFLSRGQYVYCFVQGTGG